MQDSPMQGMWGRYFLFIVLSIGVLVLHAWLMPRRVAEAPPVEAEKTDAKTAPPAAKPEAKPEVKPAPALPAVEKPKPQVEPEHPERLITLGSVDPQSPYRMLVTLTTRGAAVARVELSDPKFRDVEDRSGYLGQVAVDDNPKENGVIVQVVGDGTPAADVGLRPGDRITRVGSDEVRDLSSFEKALSKTHPRDQIALRVEREGQDAVELTVVLGRRPVEVLKPQPGVPHSFLLTLQQLDDQKLETAVDENGKKKPVDLDQELPGVRLRRANWELVAHDANRVVFRKEAASGIRITKTFELAQVAEEKHDDQTAPAYHLTLDIKIENRDGAAHRVAYQLDGPTNLPLEGWWYGSKVGRQWGAIGIRDVVVAYGDSVPVTFGCGNIGKGEWSEPIVLTEGMGPLRFVGVDAQYFSAVLIPQRENAEQGRFAQWQPIAVSEFDPQLPMKTNTSFRLGSQVRELPAGQPWSESFQVFSGPRKPALLAQYGLKEIVYYGWFSWAAIPLLGLLHFFHDYLVFNYGLAIILLTVVVRGAMFPLSRQQALASQKMQLIQPELKKIKERHGKDLQAMGKAQRELFAKHNYNPWGGCLIVFLQLPVFVGLYRALMVDVELRGASLITDRIRWASNLAAPDMLFDWSGFMPEIVNKGVGFFGLGHYFNILPIITVVLFLWQQKKVMPPPADEQAALNMKVMQYMMIFMAFMFYKVASGLCIYFIASSLWSITERQFLPKHAHPAEAEPARAAPRLPPRDNRKKNPRRR